MDYIKILDNMISSGKYVRNDIGMGRVQYSKLVMEEEELWILIISAELESPIYTRVENILVVNEEIIVFYDGEYGEILNKQNYENLKDAVTKEEWQMLFEHDAGEKLEGADIVIKDEGYYTEVHDTIDTYIEEGYDEKASLKVQKHFAL